MAFKFSDFLSLLSTFGTCPSLCHLRSPTGCPALVCPQLVRQHGVLMLGSARVPGECWLNGVDVTVDPDFVPTFVTTLWELIQHARFNPFLMSESHASPYARTHRRRHRHRYMH